MLRQLSPGRFVFRGRLPHDDHLSLCLFCREGAASRRGHPASVRSPDRRPTDHARGDGRHVRGIRHVEADLATRSRAALL